MAENSRAISEPVLISLGQQGESFDAGHRLADGMPAALRPSQNRAHFPTFLAGSFVLHLAVLMALIWAEHAPQFKPDTQQEIPVELVTDPAKDASATKGKAKPSGAAAEVKSGAAGRPFAPKPADTPKPPAPPKPEAAKPLVPKPPAPLAKPPAPAPKPLAPKPLAPKPLAPKPPTPPPKPEPKPPETKPAPEALKPSPPSPKASAPQPPAPTPPEAAKPLQAVPKPPPPMSAPAPAVKPPPAPTGPVGTPEGQPQGLMQDNSRAVAVPQPSDDGDDIVSYQTLVFACSN